MHGEKLNRWGEPEDDHPELHVDEWFPSEKSHQSEEMESLSRGFVPVGIVLGLILCTVGVVILGYAFGDEPVSVPFALAGAAVSSWGLTFLVPYGTLVYYAIKKQVLISRRDRGLPIDITPEDIDDYTLPLYSVPGVAKLMMGTLDSGGKTTPVGMKRARVATFIASALFFATMAYFALRAS